MEGESTDLYGTTNNALNSDQDPNPPQVHKTRKPRAKKEKSETVPKKPRAPRVKKEKKDVVKKETTPKRKKTDNPNPKPKGRKPRDVAMDGVMETPLRTTRGRKKLDFGGIFS